MTDFRAVLRDLVYRDPSIDFVIVHHASGDNDFFSAKPEVESCERERIVAVCQQVIDGIRESEQRHRGRAACPPDPAINPTGCPSAHQEGGNTDAHD